ncbi:lantibiotic dehydratase [Streptomyces sp. NPDC052020]|uniref:lantibiotic dehydratase n=1 Tax=Streptomyces sp. NPDC052020 TaxID=3155677 RepID=UPI003425D794
MSNGRERWRYRPLDGFAVRIPLLPAGTGARRGTSAIDLLSAPLTSLALWIGSEAMWDSLHREVPGGAPSERSIRKARRYLDRMSCRPTPYGLFAGVALGSWGDHTDLAVRRIPDRVRTHLDMGWLTALVEQLEADKRIRRQLTFTLHPAVYVAAGRLHLVDPLGALEARRPHCVTLRATGPVMELLETARRPVPYPRLVEAVRTAVPGTADSVCEQLIDRLHAAGVLLSSLRPPLTVPDPARYVLDRMAVLRDEAGRTEWLRALVEGLDHCDALAPADSLPARRALAAQAKGPASATSPPFRTDATAALSGTLLDRAVGREAAKAVELLLRTSSQPDRPPDAVAYRAAFHTRYGAWRQVPLLEVINPYTGLGLPEDTTSDLPADRSSTRAERDETLLVLAAEALRTGSRAAALDDRTLARIERQPDPRRLPGTLELVVAVAASSSAGIDSGAFRIVVSPMVGAREAGCTLGRFAFLLGDEAPTLIRSLRSAGGAPARDLIDADIVYQPLRPRSANVALCPPVHDHVLPVGVGTQSTDPPALHLADLTVSLEDDALVVRWSVTGQRVRLHSPHMLNPSAAPRVVRFLRQIDETQRLQQFDWGAAARLPFLPRLERGRVVLTPARWRLDRRLMRPTERQDFRSAFAEFRQLWQVPDLVYLAEGDHRVTVDLDSPDDMEELRRSLRRSGHVFLHERYPDPEDAWLPGPAGNHAAEIVVPVALVRAKSPRTEGNDDRASSRYSPVDRRTRLAQPGSQWVFAKIYAPTVNQDDLLAGPIHDLVRQVSATGRSTEWHFLRYADPLHHLRLRFKLRPGEHWSELATDVARALRADLDAGAVERLVFDAYDREIERFAGVRGMDLAEAVFTADSAMVLSLVRDVVRGRVSLDRTLLAVATVDDLLAALGLAAAEREALAAALAGERTASAAAFRESGATLRTLLDGGSPPEEVRHSLRRRRRAITSLGTPASLPAEWSAPGSGVAASFAHLHCNRLLGTDRPLERVVYGLLARTRHSIARWPTV